MTFHVFSPRVMRLSFIAALATACGGEVANTAPVDPEDPDVLPTGMYTVDVAEASCSLNETFRGGHQTFLSRVGAGVNYPLPSLPPPGSLGGLGAPRQDHDLRKEELAGDTACEDGSLHFSMSVTELTRSRLALRYRQEPRGGCEREACFVDYTFTLGDRACPPADDPSCTPGKRTFRFGSGASAEVTCACR